MRKVFADAFFFFAFLDEDDAAHERTRTFSELFRGEIITSEWVLLELADGYADTCHRREFIEFYESLLKDPGFRIVSLDPATFQAGLELYKARGDKASSLTDCTSFTIMKQSGVNEALTGDHHFEQAGFIALLR